MTRTFVLGIDAGMSPFLDDPDLPAFECLTGNGNYWNTRVPLKTSGDDGTMEVYRGHMGEIMRRLGDIE